MNTSPTQELRAKLKTFPRRDVLLMAKLAGISYRTLESFVSGRTASPSVDNFEAFKDGFARWQAYKADEAKLQAKHGITTAGA